MPTMWQDHAGEIGSWSWPRGSQARHLPGRRGRRAAYDHPISRRVAAGSAREQLHRLAAATLNGPRRSAGRRSSDEVSS